ncbi:MAG TPA: HPP family protein [Ktedonobacteraceae bacterium]|nr:HPP family protein [Ktedonobacteraceae bacterium]
MNQNKDEHEPIDQKLSDIGEEVVTALDDMATIVQGLITRMRLPWLMRYHNRRLTLTLFSFINGLISIAIMTALAGLTSTDLIFPSLGPTAFLFFYSPTAPSASPRNAILGHLIGILMGYLSLVVTGLTLSGPALAIGITGPRIIAVALSLALTNALMVLFDASHPPAAATTLIVSLSIISKPLELAEVMVAVVLLTLQAIVINRLAGIPYPLWKSKTGKKRSNTGLPGGSQTS